MSCEPNVEKIFETMKKKFPDWDIQLIDGKIVVKEPDDLFKSILRRKTEDKIMFGREYTTGDVVREYNALKGLKLATKPPSVDECMNKVFGDMYKSHIFKDVDVAWNLLDYANDLWFELHLPAEYVEELKRIAQSLWDLKEKAKKRVLKGKEK